MEKKRPHGSKVQLNVQVADFSWSGNEFRVKDKWKITFSFLRNAQTDWSVHFAALLVDKWPYLVTTRHNLQHKQIYPSMSSDIVQNKPTHPSWTWLTWVYFSTPRGVTPVHELPGMLCKINPKHILQLLSGDILKGWSKQEECACWRMENTSVQCWKQK